MSSLRPNDMTNMCSIEDCDTKEFARGWCHKHWNRWDRHGDPSVVHKPGKTPQVFPCDRCGITTQRVTLVREVGEHLCDTHRSEHYRRKTGVPVRTKRTPEQEREANSRWARDNHRARRIRVVEAYGGKCTCCGETELVFLAIDHIGGGGNAHRRTLTASGEIAGSSNFYKWLEKNGLPKGFQVLCHNCNFAKSHGGCPHNER
jgi:hypothetical protein